MKMFPINCAGRLYHNKDKHHSYGKGWGYLIPADYVDHHCTIGDCWIADARGNIHPGYSASPVPFGSEMIGQEVPK